jgi:hypothetical protein
VYNWHTVADPVKVIVVDDFEVFRLGLRIALDEASGFEVVGEASDARTAYELDEEPTAWPPPASCCAAIRPAGSPFCPAMPTPT